MILFLLFGAPGLAFLVVAAALWVGDKLTAGRALPGELCDRCATPDHSWPHSRGGLDTIDNLVTACWECNLSKGNRTVEEWQAGVHVMSIARPRAVIPETTRQYLYNRDHWTCSYCLRAVHDRSIHD